MSCSPFYYSGLGSCNSFRQRVIGMIISNKGTTVTVANAAVLSTWLALFAPVSGLATAIYVPSNRGYQNNTPEAETQQSNTGLVEKTFDFPPQIKVFGKMSYLDYKIFFDADGAEFDIYLLLSDGTLEGTEQSDGSLKGYRGTINVKFSAPQAENAQESYEFNIYFSDTKEWKIASTPISTNFTATDIRDSVPNGLTISVETAWNTNTVTIKLIKRGQPTAPYVYTSAGTSDFPILSARTDLNPTISAVDDTSKAIGVYILTTLAAADDLVIRAIDDDSSNRTYVSQPITIVI